MVLAAMGTLQAKDRVVNQPPFIIRNSATIEIDRITVSDTATVVDVKAFFRPKNWIRISGETYLRADNGEKYPIRSGNGINLDKEFWMPDSGEASFSLIFPTLPASVKVIDFIESDCEDCFKIWGIPLDGKLPKLQLPGTSKQLNDEPLPKAELTGGKATLKGRLLDYQKNYQVGLKIFYCDFLTGNFSNDAVKVNEDGTFTTDIELHAPTMLALNVGEGSVRLFLVPGKETEVILNTREISRKQSKLLKEKKPDGKVAYFSGVMAKLNTELNSDKYDLLNTWQEANFDLKALNGMTPDQYKTYCLGKYETAKSNIQNEKGISDATRTLLLVLNDYQCTQTLNAVQQMLRRAFAAASGMSEREAYQQFKPTKLEADYYDYIGKMKVFNSPGMFYVNGYSQNMKYITYEIDLEFEGSMKDIFSYLLASDNVAKEDKQIISEFKAAVDAKKAELPHQEKMNELRQKYDTLFQEYSKKRLAYIMDEWFVKQFGGSEGLFFDLQRTIKYANQLADFKPLNDADMQKIRQMGNSYYLNRFTAMNNSLLQTLEANKKKTGYKVNEAGEVSDEDLFFSITSPFKGKAVLVDFWATWCGPCKSAMKQMLPMKKDLEGKDVVYVFIAGENSPKETWENMIPDIHGEHYRVTEAQWAYLGKQFQIQGVPTYIILDKEGGIMHKHTGFPGVETVKKQLLDVLAK